MSSADPTAVSSRDVLVAIDDIPIAAAVVDRAGVILHINRPFHAISRLRSGAAISTLVTEFDQGALELMLIGDGDPGPQLLGLSSATKVADDIAEVTVAASANDETVVVFVSPHRFDLDLIDEMVSKAHDLHGHGVVIGDGSRIVYVSEAAAKIYGRNQSELVGMGSLFTLLDPSEQQRITDLVAEHLADDRPIPDHFETRVERPDGTIVPIEMWVKATVDTERTRTYALISDATERLAQRERLRYMATHDTLTGLANRTVLLERLGVVLERLRRQPVRATLCFIDLDDFKPVNDQLGHAAGDEVLRSIGVRLQQHVRSYDTAARLGGDEFAVLFVDMDETADHSTVLGRLRQIIGEEITGDGWTVTVDASIGTIVIDDPDVPAAALLDLADRAMYEQKHARGR